MPRVLAIASASILAMSSCSFDLGAAPFAYITNQNQSTMSVIDTATNTVIANWMIGALAYGVAVHPTGTRVYATVGGSSDSVVVIDAATGAVVAYIPVGSNALGPYGIAVDAPGTKVYAVSETNDTVAVIDTATNTVSTTITVGDQPYGVAVSSPSNRVYVSNAGSGTVSVIDGATHGVMATIPVGGRPEGIAVNATGSRVYVANNVSQSVSVIDTASNAVIATVALGSPAIGLAIDPGGTRLYVTKPGANSVSVVDTASNTVIANVQVGIYPLGVAVDPAGARVYVANSFSSSVSVIETANNAVVANIAVGSLPVAVGKFIGPASTSPPTTKLNYQGLWYNAPAESEAGWGINFAHQGDVIFATWFTYDTSGRAWWLSMTATKTTEGVYHGNLNRTSGPAFNALPFIPALVSVTAVGEGTLTFTDANNGTFHYRVNDIEQTKTITRQVFGPLPQCAFGARSNVGLAASNFQDLWYAAPAESEAGWGVNFTHQGNILFATWFTYDFDGSPLWLSGTAQKSATGVYTGTLNRTTGPAFSAQPWNKANVTLTQVGTYTLSFANGDSGSFRYQVVLGNPPVAVDQTKSITRQVFRNPGTVCQ